MELSGRHSVSSVTFTCPCVPYNSHKCVRLEVWQEVRPGLGNSWAEPSASHLHFQDLQWAQRGSFWRVWTLLINIFWWLFHDFSKTSELLNFKEPIQRNMFFFSPFRKSYDVIMVTAPLQTCTLCTVMAKCFEWQLLVFTKIAPWVFVHLFVRRFYGILEYNYKHFLSAKGFYWQLH